MNTIPPLLLTIALATGCLGAQSGVPSAADSLIVGSVLAAENRRDASDPVFTTAATHPNATIMPLARKLHRWHLRHSTPTLHGDSAIARSAAATSPATQCMRR
jgi:hypothetical protein